MDQQKEPQKTQRDAAMQEEPIPVVEFLTQHFLSSSANIINIATEEMGRRIAKKFPDGIPADYDNKKLAKEIVKPALDMQINNLFNQVPLLVAIYWISTPHESADEEKVLSNLRAWMYKILDGQLECVKQLDDLYGTKKYNRLVDFIDYSIEHRYFYATEAALEAERKSKSKYAGMASSPVTALFQASSTRTGKPQFLNDGTGMAILRNGPLTIKFADYDKFTSELKVSTRKLLDACVLRLTALNNVDKGKRGFFTEVMIPLKTYMEMCGIPYTEASRKKAMSAINKDLKSLALTTLDCEPVGRGRGKKRIGFANICDAGFIDDFDNIVFRFAPTFAEHLLKSYMMQYPLALFKVSERNPSTFNIGRKLALHNSMDSNITRGTNQIISVNSLLEACPDIPSAEQVAATDRHYQTRIIDPFEKALDELVKEKIIKWEYCNPKGAPLTSEQFTTINDYGTFSNLYIKFDMLDAPDQHARIERNAKKRERKENQKELRELKKLEAARKQAAEQAEADKQAADESDQTSDT